MPYRTCTTRVSELQPTQRLYVDALFTTGDLEGLKVSHDFTEMDEGEARILTLKDSRILDNEGVRYFDQVGGLLTCVIQRMSFKMSRWQKRTDGRRTRNSKSNVATILVMTTKSLSQEKLELGAAFSRSTTP